jgi:drug/metabolite transporter (DMT)-like permease
MKSALDLRAIVALTILCASWGLAQVATKVALAGIPPVLQMGSRSLIATVLVLLWCVALRKPMFQADGTFWPGVAVGLLFALEFVLLFYGLDLTTASRGVVFLYLAPFVVAALAHFTLGEPLTPRKMLGLVSAFLGLIIAFSDRLSMPSPDAIWGDALCVGAAIAWGLTIVVVKGSSLARVAPEKTLLYQLAISALAGLLLGLIVGETVDTGRALSVLPAFLYQAIWVAAVTYVAWFALMREYPASLLSSFTFLTPLLGVAFGAWLLDEPLSARLVAALILVAVGIYLVNRSSAQAGAKSLQRSAADVA